MVVFLQLEIPQNAISFHREQQLPFGSTHNQHSVSYNSMYQFGYPCLIIQSDVSSAESLLLTTTFPSSSSILKNSPASWKMLLCANTRGGISSVSPLTTILLPRTKSSAHYNSHPHRSTTKKRGYVKSEEVKRLRRCLFDWIRAQLASNSLCSVALSASTSSSRALPYNWRRSSLESNTG